MSATSKIVHDRTEIEADQTLAAVKEFKGFLDKVEKDLSRTARKFSKREVAESARFVADGIHEAQNYLAIVKKVIERTRLIMSKKRTSNEPLGVDTETGESQSTAIQPQLQLALSKTKVNPSSA